TSPRRCRPRHECWSAASANSRNRYTRRAGYMGSVRSARGCELCCRCWPGPLVTAWVLTFAATLLELPVSQLPYPPGKPPVAIGITKALENYDYGGGTAMEVLAIGPALAVVAVVWGLFNVLAPSGWRRIEARSGR